MTDLTNGTNDVGSMNFFLCAWLKDLVYLVLSPMLPFSIKKIL